MKVFDKRFCALGEGPLWHPTRNALLWFDILGNTLHKRQGDIATEWAFEEQFSAAGWVDESTLIIASETALWRFDLETGQKQHLIALEADNPETRSNDGRADPWGGFWIGTMGKKAEAKAGAIYRYFKGEIRQLHNGITVSNTICFAPDRSCAYFSDTESQKIMRQPLAVEDGWPLGEASLFADLRGTKLFPDGAVADADGNLWIAMWGAACVVCLSPEGAEISRVPVAAKQASCPAFGGPDLTDLFLTTARVNLSEGEIEKRPHNGATFVAHNIAQGLPEPRVLL